MLKKNNLQFDEGFAVDPFSVELIKTIDEIKPEVDFAFNEEIKNYFDKAEKIINNAVEKNDVVVEGTYNILGVNVYNAIFYKNYIISIYFLMYGEMQAPKIEYGNFVIETKKPYKLSRIYKYE